MAGISGPVPLIEKRKTLYLLLPMSLPGWRVNAHTQHSLEFPQTRLLSDFSSTGLTSTVPGWEKTSDVSYAWEKHTDIPGRKFLGGISILKFITKGYTYTFINH